MILGIGVDIVKISRMEKWITNTPLLERYFTEAEVKSVEGKGVGSLASLAARFAAKEAFGKALGIGLKGVALKEIEVINNNLGKPEIVLYGSAKKAFSTTGAKHIHLSLSHEKEHAVAMVIIEGDS